MRDIVIFVTNHKVNKSTQHQDHDTRFRYENYNVSWGINKYNAKAIFLSESRRTIGVDEGTAIISLDF